jgi:uncharacterized protein YwlG (UPF0340 family)
MVVPVRVGLAILLVLLDFQVLEHLVRGVLVERAITQENTVQAVEGVLVLLAIMEQHPLGGTVERV